jgi:hypothetical protein
MKTLAKPLVIIWALSLMAVAAFANLSATVNWNAVGDPDLGGYKLYRGFMACSAAGARPLLTSVGKTTTSYTDNSIPDGTSVVSYRVSSFDTAGNESGQSVCVEKVFAAQPPADDHTAILLAIDLLKLRMAAAEADIAILKEQRDRLKAGWCALKGSSLTKDVLAERAALGGCP